ncbi:MAG: TonB-dependent receptor [Fluviicola sp.]|nr:TonB-dependent receptor [Fluviicola sp.]
MRNLILVLVLFLGAFSSAYSQTGAIEGKITAADSAGTFPGVLVHLQKQNIGATTNGNGYYSIKNVSVGEYNLVVSYTGYEKIITPITVKENETLLLNFSLTESISNLPEMTVTGGETGIKDIPGSVHYISPKELEKYNYTDINRVLRSVPGVNVQEEDGFGLFPNIGLRGTGVERNTKITVMEDGVLIAPAPYAAPAAYYFPSMGRMQGIEILKGSSQIKYGPYTTGGAINLISTQIPTSFSGKVTMLGGSFGGRNLHVVVGNAHKNVSYMVETFQFSSDGFKQIDVAKNGSSRNSGFVKQDYLAKIRINTNPDAKIYQSLTFKMGQALGAINETYLGLTQEDFDANPIRRYAGSQMDEINTRQTQFSLTHNVKFSKHVQLTTVAYRTNFKRNWYKLDRVKDSTGTKTKIATLLEDPSATPEAFEVLKGGNSVNDDALFVKANNRSYYSQGVQTKLNINFKTNKIKHDIDLGLRVHEDQIDRFQWFDEYAMNEGVMLLTKAGTHGTESNRVETANAVAAYLQYKIKVKKLTVIPGIRYENITQTRWDYGKNDVERTGVDLSTRSNTVDVFIPGIGADYRLNKSMSIFAGVHKGFAPPGSKKELVPEESINYELGTRYNRKGLSGQLVVFFNNYSNLLGADLEAAGGGGTNEQFNGGAAQTTGIEFNATYDLLYFKEKSAFSLPVSVVYSYTNAKFLNSFDSQSEGWGSISAGDQFPYMANNQLTVILGVEHHLFNFSLSGKYIDAMRTSPGRGTILASDKIDSYFVIDASISYNVHKNISLFANATNISNEVYVVARRPAGLRPGMPRAFNLGLKANF